MVEEVTATELIRVEATSVLTVPSSLVGALDSQLLVQSMNMLVQVRLVPILHAAIAWERDIGRKIALCLNVEGIVVRGYLLFDLKPCQYTSVGDQGLWAQMTRCVR